MTLLLLASALIAVAVAVILRRARVDLAAETGDVSFAYEKKLAEVKDVLGLAQFVAAALAVFLLTAALVGAV